MEDRYIINQSIETYVKEGGHRTHSYIGGHMSHFVVIWKCEAYET